MDFFVSEIYNTYKIGTMNFMNSMAHLSFSIKRTVAVVIPPTTLNNYVLNGDTSDPAITVNTYSGTATIANWTKSTTTASTQIYICNGTSGFQCATLPSQQYFAMQIYNTNGTLYITQSIYLPVGNYNLSFYSWPRQGFSIGITLSVYLDANNLTPTPISYVAGADASLKTITITISTTGNYVLKFAGTNSVGGDTSLGFGKISLVKLTDNTNATNNLISGVTPWGIYDASLWNPTSKTLPEARGITVRDASGTGIIDYSVVSGNGTTASISQIAGNISSTLSWPAGSIPAGNFTICAITRYTGSTNKNRILTSTGNPSTNNSFFGHSGSGVGSTYYNSAQRSNAISATATDWLIICCRSGGSTASNTVYLNNVPSGTALGGTGSADILGINKYYNGTSITETSDWALSYVIIYDSVLTDAQMAIVSTKLRDYLPIPTTFTVSQPSYLQFNYRFNTGDIVSNNLANYASGTAVYDASVNAGASIISTAGNVAFGSGSMYFNGSASIQLPSFTTDLNGVSVSCWFKSSSTTLFRVCDFATDTTGGNNIVVAPTDGVQIYKGTGSTTTPAVNLNNNAWQHLIFTSEKIIDANDSSGNFRLYINGVVNNTYSNSNFYYPPALTRTINYFGKSNNATPTYLTGYIDEFRLYKKALSAIEAKNLYYYNNTTLSFNSLTFNGTNQYGILSDPTYYTDSFDSVGGTIEVWFKTTTNNTSYSPLISKDLYYAIFILNGKITVYNWGGSLSIDSGIFVADGKWHHVAITFKSGTSTNCIYIDGVFIKNYSFTYDTVTITSIFNKSLKIGAYNDMRQYLTGSLANIRIWNTQKTAAQISEMYNKYIDPALNSDLIGFYSFNEGSGTTVNNNSSRNRYAFDLSNSPVWSSVDIPTIKRNQGVLPSIPDGCRGLYACKWVNSNYTGPILKLRKSSQADNTNATNFYIDKTGTVVTTLPDASGTTFASWIGSDIAYVNVWYDQSLGGRDASQATTNRQPSYDSTNKRLNFTNNVKAYFNLTSGTLPYNNSSYTYIFKHGIVSSVSQGVLSGSDNLTFRFNANGYREEHPITGSYYSWANSNPGTISVATYKYDKTSTQLSCYVSGASLGNVQTVAISASASLSGNNYIGYNIGYADNNALETELMHFSVYNTALSDNDRQSMENIDDTIVNKNFSQSITGTSQIVYNETPVIGWTLSAVDNSNVTFLIASVLDTVYLEGTMTTAPYVALPSSITQFMVSKLTASGYSQSITQTIAITSAGYYTFSFYHAGRTGTNLYSSSHTLTVKLGSTTIVANLTTSTLGWQQYTGYLEFSTLDIGTKDLIFTFSSSSSLNSSYYITGVDFVFTSPLALYSSVPVGSVGLFACRWVNNAYTGPILQLRNASTIQDFYMDKTGTVITTGPNGTGTTFASWIGGATAYVVIWYDQSVTGSTGGRNATMTLSNGEKNQPTFTTTDKIMFANNGLNSQFLILPTSMFPNGNNPYTMSYKIKNGTGITTSTYSTVLLYGTRLTSEFHLFINPSSTSTIFYNAGWAQANASKTITSWVQPNTIITNKYESNTRSIYYNGEFANSVAYTLNFTNGPSVSSINTTGTQAYSSGSNTIGSGRNEQYVYNLGGSLDFISLFTTALNDQDRIKIEKIDDIYSTFIVNGNFIDYITGTSQTVLNSTPVINWTLSAVDSSNAKFLISKTTDGTYARGASATAPFVTLPATITQFMVSQIITAGYSQTISQLVKVASAGTYTLTFYYAGRSTASKYTVNHTLTVSFGSTTLVTNLTASTSGWQLYTGTVTMATADIGIKNLKFTFYNGETFDSSYYITGVNVVYSSNLNTINTNTINNLIPGVTPWGIYDASLWSDTTKILPEARGFTAKDASGNASGTFTYNSAISGNGTVASIPQLSGNTTTSLIWPAGSMPANTFTICCITRYTGTTNKQRILSSLQRGTGNAVNNIFGHHGTYGVGFTYYNGDVIRSNGISGITATNWINVCCRSGNTNANTNVYLNGVASGTTTSAPGTSSASDSLCINNYLQTSTSTIYEASSDWAFTYLLIYDSILTDAQMLTVSTKLQNYLATGSMVDSYTTSISRAIYPSVPTGSVGLYACKWVNNNYRGPILKLRRNNDTTTTGTTGATLQDFYIDKTGTVVTTAPDGSGNTFATWLSTNSATTAYVVIWYDQTLGGNHGIQGTIAYQPKLVLFNGLYTVYFYTAGGADPVYMGLTKPAFNTGNNSFTIIYKIPDTTLITSSDFKMAFSTGSNSSAQKIQQGFLNRAIIHTWYGGNGATYTPTWSNNLIVSCDYNSASTYSKRIYLNGASTPVATLESGTVLSLSYSSSTPDIYGCIGALGGEYSSGSIINTTYCLTGSISHLSLYNNMLGTANRQMMENIDDTISNRNFGQPITGTSQLVSNDTPVYGWTLSAIDNTNSAFLIATTSDTTTYTRGTNVASPYVALPATITQFLVSQIVTAGYSHTVTQSVAITSAGYYSFTFYHAGRSTASSYSTNHTLTVTLGSSTVVTDLSTNVAGWQQYAGVLTLATGDIGTKTLTFTFTSTTANSSFYVTGVDISLSGLIINTLSNNTTIIKDLIPGVTPWGIYDASLWNGSTKFLPEARGITARDASGSGAGTFTYNSAISGNGATASVPQITGASTDTLTWPAGSIPTNYTLCAISRYSGATKAKIFQYNPNTTRYFTFGHNEGQRGVFYDGDNSSGWKTSTAGISGTVTDWLVMCGKKSTGAGSVLANGLQVGTGSNAGTGSGILSISTSDFAFTYLVIYDSVLTDAQMASVSAKLQNYLNYGTMVTAVDPTMVFNYRFNTGDISGTLLANYATGTAVYDATIVNSATVDTTTKQFGTASLLLTNNDNAGSTSAPYQYITLPNFTTDLSGLSISIWIKSKTNNTLSSMVYSFTSSLGGTFTDAVSLYPHYGLVSNGGTIITGTLSKNTGGWNHIVFTFECTNTTTKVGTVKSYFNGTFSNSYTNVTYPNNTTRIQNFLGRSPNCYNTGEFTTGPFDPYYNGNMDEFKMYKRVLNANEVTNLYNINDPGPGHY